MPDPTVNQGHYDQILTNVSVAYQQRAEGFVADKVFPVVPVNFASGFYFEFPRGYFLRDEVGPRPMGGYPRHVGYQITKKPYLAEEEALEAWLDDRERANATPPNDPEVRKTQLLTSQHMIHRDRRWATNFFQQGLWTTDVQGVGAGPTGNQILQWNSASSTPIQDIDAWRDVIGQSTGFYPNTLVLGRKAFRVLKSNPSILDRIKYTERGMITQALLASLFDIPNVLVPSAIYNTGAEGQTDSFSFIIPQDAALLVYTADNAALDTPSGGYIFAWTGLMNDAFNPAVGVYRGRDDRAYSDWFHVRTAYDMRVVSPDLGVFFYTAVA